jgi:predicted RNA-binding protein YlqC (UPF0109 family)
MAKAEMKELVRYLAESLVSEPESVNVEETKGPDATIIELNVAPQDMGKVIGRQGRIAKAMRTVVKAATPRDENPVFVEIQ